MDLNSKREGNDSSRFTDRNLVGKSIKGLSRKKKVDTLVPGNAARKHSSKAQTYITDKSKKDVDEVNEISDQQEGEGENPEGDNQGEEGEQQLDHNKMLKDIKVSNNKLNMITLSVIVVFLTYFSTCFGISLNYLS